ncbi:MAG: hypothetical protein IJH34_07945 [Romboutsia sp.]|nr:hypothetical protein [Romboutsia sp.]
MDFAELIELKLEQNGMNRKELYDIIKSSFYEPSEEKYISVPTFYARIAENKITAEDMVYIAAVLDINLADIPENVKRLIKVNKQGVCAQFKLLMKMYSSWYKNNSNDKDVEFISTNESSSYINNRFYMITMDHINKSVSLELFDFEDMEVETLVNVNINSELDSSMYESFKMMSTENKLEYLLGKKREYELIFSKEKFKNVYELQHRAFDIPESEFKVEFGWDNVGVEKHGKNTKERIEHAIIDAMINGIGFGCENKIEKINVTMHERVSFRVVFSDAINKDGKIFIYNKIKIEEIW